MKNAKALLGALILMGNVAAGATALAADGILPDEDLSADNYCHEKFPAMTSRSLATNDPMLKSGQSGDVIDFYGTCGERPTGRDQVLEQKLENQHRWANDYED